MVDPDALLTHFVAGEISAAEALFPLVYDELRAIAAAQLRGFAGARTLQPTAIVHEAFLRLIKRETSFADAAHFKAVAAKAMRSLLIDHVRRKNATKRGGDHSRITLTDVPLSTTSTDVDLLALDESLEDLKALDARRARVVECRFFGGLTINETALALGVSTTTVDEDWRLARAWIAVRLGDRD
ncbi:MAG: sigma-70 family RNA polymerase sigma factor [Phycisphaerales bacterium]|nr:sigma-70 family RNA polymerase sigma factor [Phycisphaerales bacterium]